MNIEQTIQLSNEASEKALGETSEKALGETSETHWVPSQAKDG
jgi:hypothetical protein